MINASTFAPVRYCLAGLTLTSLLLFVLSAAFAQTSVRLQPAIGVALSYASISGSKSDFRPRVLPHAGVNILVPVDGGVSIKTGVLYQQKGWHVHSSTVDTDQYRTEFYGTVKLHELTIPLQLQYAHSAGRSFTYSMAAGVSYDFTLLAENDLTIETYKGEKLRGTQTASWNPYIGLIPDDSRLKSSFDGTAYYLFNPSLRLEAGVQWKKRYGAQVYWEHSINSVNATYGNTTPIKVGCLGISLSVFLGR